MTLTDLKKNSKQVVSFLLIIGLVLGLFFALKLIRTRQDIRKKAGASNVTLSIYPALERLSVGEEKPFDLIATFTGGSAQERIDYLKVSLTFSKTYLRVPDDKPIQTSFSTNQVNFGRILRVDTPTDINYKGKIIIEMAAASKNAGPTTNVPLTVARIYFHAISQTPSQQEIKIESVEVVNNAYPDPVTIPYTTASGKYTVGEGVQPTQTTSPTWPSEISPSPTTVSDVSPTEVASLTPSATSVPVDPNAVFIRFAVKLLGAENTPEIKVRLKLIDLVNQLTPAPTPADWCQEAGNGQYLYKNIILTAQADGVYRPKKGSSFNYGRASYQITQDGWLPLIGANPGRVYSISVKGPKHRNVVMLANVRLEGGQQNTQDFDWTGKPLEVGDLPDPNNNLLQDCVVNSVDLSLISDRIGATSQEDLAVADVNYDGIVNGNDVSKVVNTLSTKPDDDN